MIVILEILEDGHIVYIDTDHLQQIDQVSGRKIIDHLKDDINDGTDKTGHAQYRKILADHGVISAQDLAAWRAKHQVEEKEYVGITDDS